MHGYGWDRHRLNLGGGSCGPIYLYVGYIIYVYMHTLSGISGRLQPHVYTFSGISDDKWRCSGGLHDQKKKKQK